jgi:SNF2 family DNA or RNA helicase
MEYYFAVFCKFSKVCKIFFLLVFSPFQNNLYEYYVMANWVRPDCLKSASEFKRDYVMPIMDGLKADSSEGQKMRQEELIYELHKILRPFVHRKDSTILQQDLPFIQQAVIVVRQSRVQ